ncbi:MAG: hypothetical protein LBV52_05070 [Spirochaetaceae bacterium]|jgi:trk system potassium uptake protein TrkH|nr:hypothetical protein [Spirochaetaceae bacterium]
MAFYIMLTSIGALLLLLSGMDGKSLLIRDAFFISTAAVCNAGLSTIEVCELSFRSQIIILFLTQIGALGIIAFSVVVFTIPGSRFSISRQSSIQNYYLDGVEYNPRKIVRNILLFTFVIESFGAVVLYFLFKLAGVPNTLFSAVFHSVSAFCNTGFSIFPNGISDFRTNNLVIFIFSVLIFLGGIGFIVMNDILLCLLRRKRKLSYHSKVILGATAVIIVCGTIFFFFSENDRAYKALNIKDSISNAMFQSINTRSGGFEIIPQKDLHGSSKFVTCAFMFIGGAPGSIAGGIKLTVVFVLFFVIFKKPDTDGDINVFRRRITRSTIHKVTVYLIKSIALLFIFILLLLITETDSANIIAFEVLSAFTTVGLSINSELSDTGKWLMMFAMFFGRIGLVTLAFPLVKSKSYTVTYPEGTLLL